jgi:hypothetical protein
MTFSRLGVFSLQIRLALMRFGLIKSIASIFCIAGLTAWLWAIPNLRAQQSAQQQNWLRAQQALQATDVTKQTDPQTLAEDNFNHFVDVLGDAHDTEQQIRILFALSRKTGLTLSQAEYKLVEDKNGLYRSYQILLPVKGSYGAIRQFCEKTLLAIPFASLDEMSFKRETIASDALEARLRFTLYLSESRSGDLSKGKQNLIRKDAL